MSSGATCCASLWIGGMEPCSAIGSWGSWAVRSCLAQHTTLSTGKIAAAQPLPWFLTGDLRSSCSRERELQQHSSKSARNVSTVRLNLSQQCVGSALRAGFTCEAGQCLARMRALLPRSCLT